VCVCLWGGGLLVKIQRRRELRDAESKGKGMGEMQRAKAKGWLAGLDLEKERIERCRAKVKGGDWGEMQRAAAGFVFRNAALSLGLKNILFILVFF